MKSLYLWIIVGVLGFTFTMFDVHCFSWKKDQKIERLVIVPSSPKQETGQPAFPEALDKNTEIEHHQGPVGIGKYLFQAGKSLLSSFTEKKDTDQTASDGQTRYPRTHQVGSPNKEKGMEQSSSSDSKPDPADASGGPLPAPSLLEKEVTPRSADVQSSVGSNLSSSLRPTQWPRVSTRPLLPPRLFETQDTLLFGSFNVNPWDSEDMSGSYPLLMEQFLTILSQFDLVAIQGLRTNRVGLLEDIVNALNQATGRSFDFVVAPGALQATPNDPVQAFLYDTAALEVGKGTIYRMGQPGKTFQYPPVAVQFRVKKTATPQFAFTFYAVNLFLSSTREAEELRSLPGVLQTIQEKNSNNPEDDVVFFGHFYLSPQEIAEQNLLAGMPNIRWSNYTPNNTVGTFQQVSENILICSPTTTEYTSHGGIWDLRQQFRGASTIAFDYHPTWAEFSVYEGGKP